MLAAQIHGKLKREEEDLEDLLTSNVFGSIQYIPPEDGLVPVLSAAERVDGSQPLRELTEISEVNYYFWRTHIGQEIDIIKESNGALQAIECKWTEETSLVPTAWKDAYPSATFNVIHKENYLDYLLD